MHILTLTFELFFMNKNFSSKGETTRKLVLLEYCTKPIFCGIDAIIDKYKIYDISVLL